jgi:regulator of nonsense transcripts 3
MRKDKERDKERKVSQPELNNERLKTVVRRLPPNLPEDIFWQSVQPWVSDDTTIWKTYYPGKLRKRYVPLFSWINRYLSIFFFSSACFQVRTRRISHPAHILRSRRKNNWLCEYDGHVFRDKTGAIPSVSGMDN